MDAQTPYGAVLQEVIRRLQGKGIVEIPRIGRIDGEHHAIADIPIAGSKGTYFIEDRRLRLGQSAFRECGLKFSARDDGLH